MSSSTQGCPLDRIGCDGTSIVNVQNHMDYSNCRIMFTNDQKARMRSVLLGVRSELPEGSGPPPPNQPPTVSFNSPLNGSVTEPRQVINIDIAASDDKGVVLVQFYMDNQFITSWTRAPYRLGWGPITARDYTLKAVATDTDGLTAETSITVTVGEPNPNQRPTARFSFNTDELQVIFDGTESSDPDGTIASYSWNFGDGSAGSGSVVSHVYPEAGTYNVVLTVTDNKGAVHSVAHSVTVEVIPSGSVKIGDILKNEDNTLTFKLD